MNLVDQNKAKCHPWIYKLVMWNIKCYSQCSEATFFSLEW